MRKFIKWCDKCEETIYQNKLLLVIAVIATLGFLWAFAWLAKAFVQCY
jgi:hypothetical protein